MYFILAQVLVRQLKANINIREIRESPVLVMALGLPPSPALLLHCFLWQ